MGVFSFANAGLHSVFQEMWALVFVCASQGCGRRNVLPQLVCSACGAPLPVLGELGSFTQSWHRATTDYER
eukprot:12826843-Alexandrium_andersonii.AAC.1